MLATLISSLLVLVPAPGIARTYAPASVSRGTLSFRVEDVAAGSIRRVRIMHHGQLREFAADEVRAAVREHRLVEAPIVPSTPDPGDARLVVYTDDGPAPDAPPDPRTDTPDSAPCAAGLADFVAGAWPSPCWRPYADDSPFNQPIPAQPRIDPRSADYVRELTGSGRGPSDLEAGIADTTEDWQHPTYYAHPGDPQYRISCWEPYKGCEVEGAEVRIPPVARPAGTWKLGRRGDGHMTVVDTTSGAEYDFWNVTAPPGDVKPRADGTRVLRVGWGGITSVNGDGLGSNGTASYFGNLAGIIRAPELQSGEIDHALFMVIRCSAEAWVYPAHDHGSICDDRAGAIPLGTRFQLDMTDDEIRALDVPSWKRTILRAMAHYGMYAGDTGGSPWDLQFESGSTYTSFGRPDPLVALARDNGVEQRDGVYHFDVADDVDWARRLRVIAPCVARQTC